MKTIVIYSSKTGNTKKIAAAIAAVCPAETDCVAIKDAPSDLKDYDLAFIGYWVDKGTANAAARAYMEKVNAKNVAVFETLGAYPDSDHAKQSLENGQALIKANVIGGFISQGKVDPVLVEAMKKMFPAGHPHGDSPERRARIAEATKHPNEDDFIRAREFARAMLDKIAKS